MRRRRAVLGGSAAIAVAVLFGVLLARTGGAAGVCTPLGTTTAKLLLCQPASGETGWATAINNNAAILDALFTGTNPNEALTIGHGGTGAITAAAGFNALSPMTTLGDLIYGGASGAGTRLAGNTTTQQQFLVQTGTGTVSAAPLWHTLVAADVTDLATAATGITKVGTVTTGTWNGSLLTGAYGGTGINNGTSTITLGGNLATSGAFATTLTVTGATNVTLPTSGTLSTLAGLETLSNKTLGAGTLLGSSVALGGGASATLGTIGGSGPTAAAQNSWMQIKDSSGATVWTAVWK